MFRKVKTAEGVSLKYSQRKDTANMVTISKFLCTPNSGERVGARGRQIGVEGRKVSVIKMLVQLKAKQGKPFFYFPAGFPTAFIMPICPVNCKAFSLLFLQNFFGCRLCNALCKLLFWSKYGELLF